MVFFSTTESFLLLHTNVLWKTAKQWLNTRALNLSDGAGVGSPWGTDWLPSSRITQETKGKKILGLAQKGERLEQFLYRNVLIAVTCFSKFMHFFCFMPYRGGDKIKSLMDTNSDESKPVFFSMGWKRNGYNNYCNWIQISISRASESDSWYWFGSADPYHWLTGPYPDPAQDADQHF